MKATTRAAIIDVTLAMSEVEAESLVAFLQAACVEHKDTPISGITRTFDRRDTVRVAVATIEALIAAVKQ